MSRSSRKDRKDAKDHNGAQNSRTGTPKDCQACHAIEATEFQASRHADASVHRLTGQYAWRDSGAGAGSQRGMQAMPTASTVTVTAGKLERGHVPNTGIGE